MIKNIEKSNENVAINDREIAILKEHFPTCFKNDGSFDIERFKETLKDKVDVVHEGYELKFLGKSYAKLLASLDTTTVITPNEEHNNQPENANSENIYISGDNLDGLKHLLKSYAKSVKCIYIDPPYNTGSDGFVYKDNFNFTAEELQDKLSVDENQANRILELTQKGSASHSAWLLFMYARLQLAKDLLKDDGVIFISIDDNEQANLKLLCDDIFGEENTEQYIWDVREDGTMPKTAKNTVRKEHEYIIAVFRKPENKKLNKYRSFKYTENEEWGNPDNDPRGPWMSANMSRGSGKGTGGSKSYIIKNPAGVDFDRDWSVYEHEYYELLNDNRIYFANDGEGVPRRKIFQNEEVESIQSSIFEKLKSSQFGKNEIKQLGLDVNFDYPKPTTLLKRLIQISSGDNDIILDFFSGSATTVDSIIQLNEEYNQKRRFIVIQLPEELDKNNPNQLKTYQFLESINKPKTLDYVGVERIKSASKFYYKQTKDTKIIGFKHFILNEPNPNTLDKCESFDKVNLIGDGSILEDFGVETVLTTWLNYDGYGLTTKATEIDLKGYTAYYNQKHLYLIHTDFTQEAVMELFEKYDTIPHFNPENIVLFGYSFNEWSVTEMLEKNLKILNDTEKNLKINIEVRY